MVLKPAARSRPVRARLRLRFSRRQLWCLALLLLGLGAGCRVVQATFNLPARAVRSLTGTNHKNQNNPVEVQEELLRFADGFLARMVVGIDRLRRDGNALEPAESLRWKIALCAETTSIASGPNQFAGLLDMASFVTVCRMTVEEHWQPAVFGASARPLLGILRDAETEIWLITGRLLNEDQQAELRKSIEVWHTENPAPESILGARTTGFAGEVAKASKSSASKPDSVFNFLMLDPLAGLDPAVREVAQARMFGDRALFVAQKMPVILAWQTELLSIRAANIPNVQQFVSNSTELASSAHRFADVAGKLPAQVSEERAQIVKALNSQEGELTTLAGEVRGTLVAGNQMSTSLNSTLNTFRSVLKDLGVGETNSPGATNAASPESTNSQPFRVQDYGAAAAQVSSASRQLTEMLVTFNQILGSTNLGNLSAQLLPAVREARTAQEHVVDHAFRKGVEFALVLVASGLLYRFLSTRRPFTPRPKER